MTDPRVNRYRSGAKRKEQEIIVSHNDDGSKTVVVFDGAKGTIKSHSFPGAEEPTVEQGLENSD